MSTALIAAGHLKAEIRLAQAISEFEASLLADEKATFKSHRQKALDSPLMTQDVMKLTAEIDSKGRRCYGPRFTSILGAIQKFASIGDVLIGGSQNLIACGVWTVVRMGLLAISSTATILEKVSAMFMAVGRSAPRYEKLAILYPQSQDLQNQLCEYYIILVRLCQKLIKISKKSTLGQLVSPISESELSSAQTSLEQWAVSIRDEVQLLLAQKVENESGLNSRFRELSTHFSNTAARYHKLKTRTRLLDTCSTYDYEKSWKALRKAGKATLHINDKNYLAWRDSTTSKKFSIRGKLGSGKSVMVANIVDDIYLTQATRNPLVAYFFCRWDIIDSLNARVIVGSILRQLLASVVETPSIERSMALAAESLSQRTVTMTLMEVILKLLPEERPIYILTDSLGDCTAAAVAEVQSALHLLIKKRKVYLCSTRRIGATIAARITDGLEFSIPVHDNHDIDQYITDELSRRLESGRLVVGDPSIVLEVQDQLKSGSQGFFLWTALQIDSICRQKTDAAIRLCLKALPTTLAETFARILKDTKVAEDSRYQQDIFQLAMIARQPITTEELRIALSVELWNFTPDSTKLINNIYDVLATCGSLITIDEEDDTVHIVHPSFHKYLLPESDQGSLDLHRKMADILITYLNYPAPSQELVKANAQDTESMPHKIVQSLPSSTTRDLALRLLQRQRTSNAPTWRLGLGVKSDAWKGLLKYARANLKHHVWVEIPKPREDLYAYISVALNGEDTQLKGAQNIADTNWDLNPGLNILIDASHHEYPTNAGIIYALQHSIIGDVVVDKLKRTVWEWALEHDYDLLLKMLLGLQRHPFLESVLIPDNVLVGRVYQLLRSGRFELAVKALFTNKPDMGCLVPWRYTGFRGDSGKSYLGECIQILHLVAIQRLIWNFSDGRRIARVLVAAGSSPTFMLPQMPSAFFLALSAQEWKTAEYFLSTGANINHVDGHRRTLLHNLCTPELRPKAIAWLSQHGADLSLKNDQGQTIVEALTKNAARRLVMVLLQAGMSIDEPLVLTIRYKFLDVELTRVVPWTEMEDLPKEKALTLTNTSIRDHAMRHRAKPPFQLRQIF